MAFSVCAWSSVCLVVRISLSTPRAMRLGDVFMAWVRTLVQGAMDVGDWALT